MYVGVILASDMPLKDAELRMVCSVFASVPLLLFQRAFAYHGLFIFLQVYPDKGTVCFSAGLHGWAFTLTVFSKLYAKKVYASSISSCSYAGVNGQFCSHN